MHLATTCVGKATIVRFPEGSLDASNTKAARDALTPLLAEPCDLVFDLGGLQFVDSSGLGVLLSCLRQQSSTGGTLRLFGLTKPVRALFELVRMHRVFDLYNTEDEAIRSLG